MNFLILDIRSIIVTLFIGNLTLLALLAVYKNVLISQREYRQFFMGRLSQAIAWLLLGLRDFIPIDYSANMGNYLLYIGLALEALSLSAVSMPRRNMEKAFLIIALGGVVVFAVFATNPGMKVGIASLVASLLFITASASILRAQAGSGLRRIIGLFYGFLSLIMLVRSWYGFSSPDFSLMTSHLIQTLSFIPIFILMMVGGIGFLLLLKERDDMLLEESEDKYSSLVQKANEAIIILQDHCFVFTNPRMGEMLGMPHEALVGKIFADYINPADREMVVANYEKRITGDNPPDAYEFRVIGPDGKSLWVNLSVTSISWSGRPAVLCLLTDINDRKELEKERIQSIHDLQKALADVKTLSGLLPICASCKKIRDDKGYWNQIEMYIRQHSEAEFSHSLCPDCIKKLYPEMG